MKHTKLTRMISFLLAMVLILGTIPAAMAQEEESIELTKVAADLPEGFPGLPEAFEEVQESLELEEAPTVDEDDPYVEMTKEAIELPEEGEAGHGQLDLGSAPTVADALTDYSTTREREPNNYYSQANAFKVGDIIRGYNNSSDRVDIFKFTLSSRTELFINSISDLPVMVFGVFTSNGRQLDVCDYYGNSGSWYYDGIEITLDRGTYYIQVQQTNYGGISAYAYQLDYALEIHTHKYSYSYPVLPTCTERGYTIRYCSCGESYNDSYKEPRHTYGPSSDGNYVCCLCGRTSYEDAFRVFGSDRIATSLSISNHVWGFLPTTEFENVVVASASNFPDALTGSYLAAVADAPILLTMPSSQDAILDYIEANLDPNGTVYILGGTSAVPASFANELADRDIYYRRLKGSDRYGTNLAILRAAGMSSYEPVIICTGKGFADSLSASATGFPILLVGDQLTNDQISFLYDTSRQFIIVGGTGAVSRTVEAQLRSLGSVERIAGSSRYETSVMVAERFFENPTRAVLAYAKNFPDGLCGGPLAYQMGAPLILTSDSDYHVARNFCEAYGIGNGYVLGGSSLVSDATVRRIFSLPSSAAVLPG